MISYKKSELICSCKLIGICLSSYFLMFSSEPIVECGIRFQSYWISIVLNFPQNSRSSSILCPSFEINISVFAIFNYCLCFLSSIEIFLDSWNGFLILLLINVSPIIFRVPVNDQIGKWCVYERERLSIPLSQMNW